MMKKFYSVLLAVAFVFGGFVKPAKAISFADYVYQNAKYGNVSAIRSYMVKGYSIDAVNPQGMTALCQAVYYKDYRTYMKLRQLGASTDVYCMQNVDVEAMEATQVQYIQPVTESTVVPSSSRAATTSSYMTAQSGDSSRIAAFAGIGLLAAGGLAALTLIDDDDDHHHNTTCPIGEKYVDGKCQPIVCPEGTTLIGNKCVPNYNCLDGEYWDGHACVKPACPEGTHREGSQCVPNDPCPTGQQLVDGVCQDIVCAEGYHLVGDGCVLDSECPAGQRMVDGVCVDIICPENTHLEGNNCVVDDNTSIVHVGDDDLIGIGSDAENVFNLLSTPSYPNAVSNIILNNEGNGDVYGMYGYSGEVFNSYVLGYNGSGNPNKIPVGVGNINIKDNGSGTVYGMYSHIADITQYKEAINASGWNNGTAYGNIDIEHNGGGTTFGLLGDVRAYNTYSSYGGNAYGKIDIKGDGDIYGIFGYVAATNALIPWLGNYSKGDINILGDGNGDIYGMAISKDDIPGAGAGGGETASWFAFNAYAGSGAVDGTINIWKTGGSGNIYGMYGGQQLYNAMSYGGIDEHGQYTSRAKGDINILNAGFNNQAYGMYMPEEDSEGIIANVNNNNSESTINIINYSNGVATGLRGGKKNTIINSGDININNMKDGTAVGIYGESNSSIDNSGTINIYRGEVVEEIDDADGHHTYVITPDGDVGGTAYGIYAENGAMVFNSGTIVITGAGDGKGIYLEKGATLENTGTVKFNGVDNSIVHNGSAIDIYGEGRTDTSSTNLVNLSNLGGGEIILGQGGKFFADELSGDMSVSNKVVQGSFDDTYIVKGALQTSDATYLNTHSKSAMFEAKKEQNSAGGYDVVLERKNFDKLIDDKTVSRFFEDNYKQGNNLEMYDNLKTAATTQAVNREAANFAGIDVLPSFRRENALVYNHLSRQFNDNLFNRPDEQYIGGYKYIDISRDSDGVLVGNDGTAHSAYGMVKGKADNGMTYGLGATITQLKSDYDNHSSRKSNVFGLWLPAGYDFRNGTKWYSKLYAGYEDGSYDRKTAAGKYSSDITAYQYGLTNELRHDIGLGGGIKLTPAAELNLLGVYQDGFDEGKRANAIHTDSYNSVSLEGGLGAYLSKEFMFGQDNSLGIQIGGIYYVEFLDPDDGMDATIRGMNGKYKISHKTNDDRAVLSARINYNYKNMTLYGMIEQETGDGKALTFDAGLEYRFF